MTNIYFNTNSRLFLIVFEGKTNNPSFIVGQDAAFKTILQENQDFKVKTIKIFDKKSQSFKATKKQFIRSCFDWLTEVDLFLNKHPYFKGTN